MTAFLLTQPDPGQRTLLSRAGAAYSHAHDDALSDAIATGVVSFTDLANIPEDVKRKCRAKGVRRVLSVFSIDPDLMAFETLFEDARERFLHHEKCYSYPVGHVTESDATHFALGILTDVLSSTPSEEP